jgi:hypothetical protein
VARKGAQKRLFRARPPARQAVRVGVVPAGRPRLPSPAAPFAHFVRRGAATLGPFAPAGLKPLAIGLGSRRLRRRYAARCARFAARPSPGPSGRAAGPPGHLRWPGRPFGEYLFGEYLIRRISSRRICCRAVPLRKRQRPGWKEASSYLAPTSLPLAPGGRCRGPRRRTGLGLRG